MTSTDPRCDLCHQPVPDAGSMRIAELDLCPDCFEGSSLDTSLATHRGLRLEHERVELRTNRGLELVYRATGTLPAGTGLTVAFGREGLGSKVTKLFKKEIQTGDPLFDDTIYVDAAITPELKRLMSSTGFQGAVMDLIGEIHDFRIEDDRVLVNMTTQYSLSPQGTLGRSVAVVMHHLDTFARRPRTL